MNIVQRSIEECRYYQILSKDLNYGDSLHLNEQLEQVSRLLTSYHLSILKTKRPGFLSSIISFFSF